MIVLGIMAICNLPSIVVGLIAGSTLDKLMRNGSELQDTTDEKEPSVNAPADETLPIDSETASAPLPVHEPQIVNVDSDEDEFNNEAKIPPIRIEIQKRRYRLWLVIYWRMLYNWNDRRYASIHKSRKKECI